MIVSLKGRLWLVIRATKLYWYGLLIQADDYEVSGSYNYDFWVLVHGFIVNLNGTTRQHSANAKYKETAMY